MRGVAGRILWGAAWALWAVSALGQSYPSKPLRLIIPYAPGGAVDFVGRQLGQHLSERLGQPVVADNRPGAGGMIGVEAAAHAPADGYTLLVVDPSVVINPSLQAKVPYDLRHDLQVVSLLTASPLVLSVPASSPFHDLGGLVEYARSHTGEATFASAGLGTTPHMAAELLKLHIGAEMVHVPYKGSGPAMADLVAGRVTMAFSTITAALPFIRDGRLRALATTGSSRPAALADIPTAEEQGLAQFQVTFWTALFAPAGVSRAVMGQLNAQVQQALDNPDLRVAMSRVSEVPARTSLEAASTWVSDEYSQWSRVVNEAHLSASP